MYLNITPKHLNHLLLYLFFYSLLSCFACRNTTMHQSKFQIDGTLDTIYHEQHNLLTGVNTKDSTQIADRIIDFALFELKKRPNVKQFRIDTTSEIIESSTSICHFVQGHLFDANATHALVEISLSIKPNYAEKQYLIFKQNEVENWIFQDIFSSPTVNNDSTFLIRDVNFDGTNDLLLQWGYSSGRCNCHFGCYDLYLYDSASNHFIRKEVFEGMLETVIVPEKKYIILGVHCYNHYTKNRWKEDRLEPFDSVFFECKGRHDNKYGVEADDCIRRCYSLQNGKATLRETKKSCEMPPDYERDFKQERIYLKEK
jgi:hypothetical protein